MSRSFWASSRFWRWIISIPEGRRANCSPLREDFVPEVNHTLNCWLFSLRSKSLGFNRQFWQYHSPFTSYTNQSLYDRKTCNSWMHTFPMISTITSITHNKLFGFIVPMTNCTFFICIVSTYNSKIRIHDRREALIIDLFLGWIKLHVTTSATFNT